MNKRFNGSGWWVMNKWLHEHCHLVVCRRLLLIYYRRVFVLLCLYSSWSTNYYELRKNISSRFSGNSEAYALELLENLEVMFLRYYAFIVSSKGVSKGVSMFRLNEAPFLLTPDICTFNMTVRFHEQLLRQDIRKRFNFLEKSSIHVFSLIFPYLTWL